MQAMRRRHFVVQNSRLLILPGEECHQHNMASRILGLCARRVVAADWTGPYGYAPVLLETFVDPRQHRGSCCKGAGWTEVGMSKGKLNRKRKGVAHACTVEKGHARIETRTAKVVPVSPADTGWPHTQLACRIERRREMLRNGETIHSSTQEAIYVGSYSPEVRSAEQTLRHYLTATAHATDRRINSHQK